MGLKGQFKVGYIGGTFDCLHSGHINLFKNAKTEVDWLIVSLNTDEFAARYKRKPIIPFKERAAVLSAIRYVDQVITNEGDENSKVAILKVMPDYIIHGDDWTGKSLMVQMGFTQEFLDKHGIKLFYLPYTPDISTTKIIKAMKPAG